jgi:hypothetical protein
LLFADDSLLFFKATCQHENIVRQAIMSFEKGSEQLISRLNALSFFSPACHVANQIETKNKLAVTKCSFEEKYLGLPTP